MEFTYFIYVHFLSCVQGTSSESFKTPKARQRTIQIDQVIDKIIRFAYSLGTSFKIQI